MMNLRNNVLGLESEDGLLEVIGAAAFRVGQFVDDTKEAIERYNELEEEQKIANTLIDSEEKLNKLNKLKEMLRTFSSVGNKFNNTIKVHSRSVIVAEQLGTLNSTIEAINRVNVIIKEKDKSESESESEKKVNDQIKKDGINMQTDNWPSIQKYIIINWTKFSTKTNLSDTEKNKLAEEAARGIISSRKEAKHPHGITWEEAIETIKKIV